MLYRMKFINYICGNTKIINNMKELIFTLIAVFILAFSSCSKDGNEPELNYAINTFESAAIEAIIKEYSIKKEGLDIESFICNLDSTILYVNGRVKGSLWVGGYEILTKRQILDFTENSKLDISINLNLGYGEYYKFDIEKYVIWPRPPYSLNGSTCFILVGRSSRGDRGEMVNGSCDLYFLHGNTLKNKYRSIYSPVRGAVNNYEEIIPWFESVMIKMGSIYLENEYQCFDLQGNYLFTANNYFHGNGEQPISLQECIKFYQMTESNSFIAERLNVKTGTTIWEKTIQPFTEKVRMGKYTIAKSNNIWDYFIPYTNFDGTKGNIQISLNIENGNFEIK